MKYLIYMVLIIIALYSLDGFIDHSEQPYTSGNLISFFNLTKQ